MEEETEGLSQGTEEESSGEEESASSEEGDVKVLEDIASEEITAEDILLALLSETYRAGVLTTEQAERIVGSLGAAELLEDAREMSEIDEEGEGGVPLDDPEVAELMREIEEESDD